MKSLRLEVLRQVDEGFAAGTLTWDTIYDHIKRPFDSDVVEREGAELMQVTAAEEDADAIDALEDEAAVAASLRADILNDWADEASANASAVVLAEGGRRIHALSRQRTRRFNDCASSIACIPPRRSPRCRKCNGIAIKRNAT